MLTMFFMNLLIVVTSIIVITASLGFIIWLGQWLYYRFGTLIAFSAVLLFLCVLVAILVTRIQSKENERFKALTNSNFFQVQIITKD